MGGNAWRIIPGFVIVRITPFISHKKAIWKGSRRSWGRKRSPWLLTTEPSPGMILQERAENQPKVPPHFDMSVATMFENRTQPQHRVRYNEEATRQPINRVGTCLAVGWQVCGSFGP